MVWACHSSRHGACSGLKVAVQALAVRGSAGEGGFTGQAPDGGVGQPSGSKWAEGGVLAEREAVSAGG